MEDFWLLLIKAKSPLDGKFYYFVDKSLPFGASISCSHFQRVNANTPEEICKVVYPKFDDAIRMCLSEGAGCWNRSHGIAHTVKFRSGKPNINYLDDFFFAAMIKLLCNRQIDTFMQICREIGMPVNLDKTFWSTTCITFLGLLINTITQTVSVPVDKIERAMTLIDKALNNRNGKVTLHQLQQLCGFLNFLGKCVVPGRTFTRRLYSYTARDKLKPHHHIRINGEMRLDLEFWRTFLRHPSAYCRPFMDFSHTLLSTEIDFYTDASGRIGFGGVCQNSFMWGLWDKQFLERENPSIDYLEMYAVAAAVLAWIHRFKNRRVTIFTDNKGVRDMLNSTVGKTNNCMVLIRIIVLKCLVENVKLSAKYVKSEDNIFADELSRGKFNLFRKDSKGKYKQEATTIPEEIWPVDKIWQEKHWSSS